MDLSVAIQISAMRTRLLFKEIYFKSVAHGKRNEIGTTKYFFNHCCF